MRWLSVIFVLLAMAFTAGRARAQAFLGGGVVAFDPEISVVYSGVKLDVQPVVSHDLKYVTINTQAQDSRLIALRNFQTQTPLQSGPALGFVGNANPTGTVQGIATSPEEIDRRAVAARSVLNQRGMFLLRVN
jgi:hypothetical protein